MTWRVIGGIAFPRAVGYDSSDELDGSGLIGDDSGAITQFQNNGESFAKAGNIPPLAAHSTRITSFAFDSDGSWYTAGHYTDGRADQVGFVLKVQTGAVLGSRF